MLYAFLRRRFLKLVGQKSFIIYLFVQPFLWLLTVGISLNTAFSSVNLGYKFISYIALNLISIVSITLPIFFSNQLIFEFTYGSLKVVRLMGIKYWKAYLLLSDSLVFLAITFLNLTIVLLVLYLLYKVTINLLGIIISLPILFIAMIISYSIGIIISSFFTGGSLNILLPLVQLILLLFSGTYYPLEFLPKPERIISFLTPYTHILALVRYFTIGYAASQLKYIYNNLFTPPIQVILSAVYVLVFTLIITYLAVRRLDSLQFNLPLG
ncbi:hypothetical protein D1867_11085 [Acidianus infernus]|uniref:ABC transmembrane type-2 domain-containing protein n=1 Tax=Acidianus infernus TaxID=12915 RepID=A0A6A9QEQ5_ACIIN|nr:ABC transporter permease [Acidianus infernus]MUM65772.1 hypothetical protein [Acidianus infernus]